MKFIFTNIDSTAIKDRHELEGEVQPKYWYRKKSNRNQKMLVKRQHSTKVLGQSKKSKMYNHYGEYFGYLLGEKAGVRVCPVELITVHDTKNKYSTTKELYAACASYNLRKNGQELTQGENVVARFVEKYSKEIRESIQAESEQCPVRPVAVHDIYDRNLDNNIDAVIEAIAYETMRYERKAGKVSSEEVAEDVKTNIQDAVDMAIYDCLFGNHDRHSSNWAMIYDSNLGKVKLYSNYDNEAVLGLRKPEAEVRKAVEDGDYLNYADSHIFSRMGFGRVNSGVTAKSMLEYLVEKYPTYAIPSIERITESVSPDYVASLYDATEGITERSAFGNELTEEDELPYEYKVLGVTLYNERRDYARNLVKQFGERNGVGVSRQKVLRMEPNDGMIRL